MTDFSATGHYFCIDQTPWIILRGKTQDVMKLAAAYYERFLDTSSK